MEDAKLIDERAQRRWSTCTVAFVGAILLWLSFPPVGLWPLVWIGLVPWLILARPDRPSRRGDRKWIYFASWLFWLGINYFVTLPHWAGIIGWVAMSAYLAIFLPLFVGFAVALQRRLRCPFAMAAPTAWVAMEWLRAHLLSGYGMAMLPHALFRQPLLIQSADLMGGYGTSWLMVAFVAGTMSFWQTRRPAPLFFALTLATVTLSYGWWRMQFSAAAEPTCPVAIIQGSRDVRFGLSAEESQREALIEFRQYRDLTVEARRKWPQVQLIVWPEGAFPAIDYLTTAESSPRDATTQSRLAERREDVQMTWLAGMGVIPLASDDSNVALLAKPLPLLTGGESIDLDRHLAYNAAFLIEGDGQIAMRYDKMHLVMFGEYVPLGKLFPFVYQWTPLPGGLEPGRRPESMSVKGFMFAPCICFESTVGHLIRRQLRELTARQSEPDCIVNLTNDGWFYGSNCLDLHLACNVFRAVELRKPVVVAANTGFSAHIDGDGRILAFGPRRKAAILEADVRRDGAAVCIGSWETGRPLR